MIRAALHMRVIEPFVRHVCNMPRTSSGTPVLGDGINTDDNHRKVTRFTVWVTRFPTLLSKVTNKG